MKSMKNEQGFTLVEVLASLTILSIILVGSYNLIIFTNEVAVSNNDRLVAVNLGKATLERVKLDPFSFFARPSDNENLSTEDFNYTSDNCEPEGCADLYKVMVNDKVYLITLTVNQNNDEERMNLIEVIVNVELPGKANHQVEGYVNYAF
ncbi:prepilin-type N-terminal cleavage/methylation domain-containing protein [Oceanobacillus piezotolerans]|uniref:Prepilin-type N-terminal cleavage/methylation domain-containing protein n=1 Tax=Oceanobacillus piezotolerans TaxID=2448030 RepID=A0A498DH90_9BACI|nr:prepilin-type N-terminal cleavage/methylation domain-containing protein [Oceanobacillus piezotolerans]RLL47869.1 prepilin-type N-terminal cleavage/methylation domain-containing protein [Oceanobacillus piezotolerans]